jgi:hypothetical protein
MEEGSPAGFSANQLNQPSAADVVGLLRSGETPEAIYDVLKQYALLNRHNPMVVSDFGNVIYIELNPQNEWISLYVGHNKDLSALGGLDGNRSFVLVISDKYQFAPVAGTRFVVRSHLNAGALSKRMLAKNPRTGIYIPALYFEVSDDPRETSYALVRNEWIPLPKEDEPEAALETPEKQFDPPEKHLLIEQEHGETQESMMARIMQDQNSEVSRSRLKPILHPMGWERLPDKEPEEEVADVSDFSDLYPMGTYKIRETAYGVTPVFHPLDTRRKRAI